MEQVLLPSCFLLSPYSSFSAVRHRRVGQLFRMSQSPTSSWGEQYLGIFRSRHIRWYCLNLGPFYLRSFVLSGEVRDSVERPESYGDGGLHSSSSQASAGDCGVPCRGEAARPALMVLSPSPMLSSSFCTTCLSPPLPYLLALQNWGSLLTLQLHSFQAPSGNARDISH